MTTATDFCPRCNKPLIRNHDSVECLTHGTIEFPMVSPEQARQETSIPNGKLRLREATATGGPEWTEEERRTWATWQPGDPIEGEDMAEPKQQSLTADGIVAMCLERVAAIDVEAADKRKRIVGIQRQISEAMRERERLVDTVRVLGGRVPDASLVCPECGRDDFTERGGLGHHRSKAHAWISPERSRGRVRTKARVP